MEEPMSNAPSKDTYYVPHDSHWPIVGSVALFTLVSGAANWLHGESFGPYLTAFGLAILIYMMFGWFGDVISESRAGYYNKQVDKSYRWGMFWFIFTEVMFFAAFFGALLYVRKFSVPWLGGYGYQELTNLLLWPDFKAVWPLTHAPDLNMFAPIKAVIPAWGLPAINTAILLTSGLTITWAHWGLVKNKRKHLNIGLAFTILLGILFLFLQAHEYHEAYTHLDLTLASGIYGATFFMLTGFHGLHVTLGTIMLIVLLFRCLRGHFSAKSHFAFEAISWYWHFVDVVWLFLFIFVYWI